MLILKRIWMELEIIMLSEINQTQKGKYYMPFHVWDLEKRTWLKGKWKRIKGRGINENNQGNIIKLNYMCR
jgi:hypothetical protein